MASRVAGLFVVARMKATVKAAAKAHVQHIALQQTRRLALARLAAKLGGESKEPLSVRRLPVPCWQRHGLRVQQALSCP